MAKRVIIIGAGVVGLCSAYYARKRGRDVTIIERNAPQRDGCSYGNAGLIVPSHFIPLAAPGMVGLGLRMMWNPTSPFYIKPRLSSDLIGWAMRFCRAATQRHVERSAPLLRDLNNASRGAYEQLAAVTGNPFDMTKSGLLMLCKTDHALEEEHHTAEYAQRLGIPAVQMNAQQTAAFDPDVRMDIAGSVHYPQDCSITPGRFITTMQEQLQRDGVTFHWDTIVTGWRHSATQLTGVETNRGVLEADEFVLGAGVWSSALARDLGLRIPMQAGKGYSVTLPNPPQLPKCPAILVEGRVAVTPMAGSLRFGGTMEVAGIDHRISPPRVRGIIDSALRYFPDFKLGHFDGIAPWCGLRPCSPDGLPYIGRTGRFDNLILATGHAMMGMSLGPITGQIVADLLTGTQPAIDIALLSPDRYA